MKQYSEPESQAAFYRDALERLRAMPGVEAAGAVTNLPMSGNSESYSFTIEGRPPLPPGEEPSADFARVTPDYFRAMQIPVRRGRVFADTDTMTAPPVIVVSDAFVKRYFPNEDPIGKKLDVGNGDEEAKEIVGVVGDIKPESPEVEARPQYYTPFFQFPDSSVNIVARTREADGTAMIRGVIKSLDKNQPITRLRTLESYISDQVATQRFNMVLLAIFAGVAMLLAALGIFGVMSYSVTRRTHEIGIRMALGAQPRNVLKLIVAHGMALALGGIVLGLGISFVATRLMQKLLFGVSATDPMIFVGIAVLLSGVALLACYLPARRATRVNPTLALRYE
jgi:putative ABC transport system permease protein